MSSPDTLQTFDTLSRALDEAVATGAEKEIVERISAIRQFYGTLTAGQQSDVMGYIEQQNAAQTIEDVRSKTYRGVTRVLHWPALALRAAGPPIAKLWGETVKLIAMALGYTVKGVVSGLATVSRR